MGEKKLRIRAMNLGSEYEPAAVGGPTVPGIHNVRVAAQSSGSASFGWYNIKLTVGLNR